MKSVVPLYVERFTADAGVQYYVRPLFFGMADASRDDLKKATDSVAGQLRKRAMALAAEPRHDEISALLYSPRVTEEHVRVHINLKRRTFQGQYLFALYEAHGRRIAFTPRLPELHFTLEAGDRLEARAAEVLAAYYRNLEREEVEFQPEWHTTRGQSWLAHLELNLDLDKLARRSEKQQQEAVESYKAEAGGAELLRVGRNLCEAWPDDLDRAVLRESSVAELSRLLWSNDKRPLALVGKSGVGKTALLHESLRRAMDGGRVAKGGARQIWLVSPQRLISGMSFVGQWENRLNSILAECRRQRHILYFDDFLGLFRAGQSASSRLSVANVLRPYIERREVRLLAEFTPEALRVLSDLDRGWSDLFHQVPVPEPSEPEVWRILLQVQRDLEARHSVRFDLDALPTVLDLMLRYRRDVALPGKAASFLAQLAGKHRHGAVNRTAVLREFEAGTGLSVTFLDERAGLGRAEIVKGLRARLIGQDQAVDAIASVVSVAKARLNDPERPLGTLLFLGPTGTGKTQCAKALAAWLYGSESSLLRFDMNEFVDGYAVSRLAGTMDDPEGLLTSAVRRRPFATILFDEIEKAHPAAFDLLLQVLGEGRLTDAIGRTVDFTNCVIILTSNLGTRQAGGGLGFSGHDVQGEQAYVNAARAFFRPEFFNRLDYVVPFTALPREHVEEIARGLLRGVMSREGLSRRLCVLEVEPEAMDAVVEQGYHPTLGARAIKRAIESRLTGPVAEQLAALAPDAPTVLRLGGRAGQLQVEVSTLVAAASEPGTCAAVSYKAFDNVVARIDAILNRAEQWLDETRPTGALSGREINPAQRRHFAVRQLYTWLDESVERLVSGVQSQSERKPHLREDGATQRLRDRAGPTADIEWDTLPPESWKSIRADSDLRALALAAAPDAGSWWRDNRLRLLAAEAARLKLMLDSPPQEQRALIAFRTLDGRGHPLVQMHVGSLEAMARRRLDLEVRRVDDPATNTYGLLATGDLAFSLLRGESATALLWAGGELGLLSTAVSQLEPAQKPDLPQPGPLQAVSRVWVETRCLDVRTGILSRQRPSLAMLQVWAAGSLMLEEPA
ncbi:MAG: ATP-dependent Clp protease ATP-binding subunit [Planctomycetes bacterium]|nr:ATP-dependent Clp protease ATP-binding subunit [Planctomycetota bacterium]